MLYLHVQWDMKWYDCYNTKHTALSLFLNKSIFCVQFGKRTWKENEITEKNPCDCAY